MSEHLIGITSALSYWSSLCRNSELSFNAAIRSVFILIKASKPSTFFSRPSAHSFLSTTHPLSCWRLFRLRWGDPLSPLQADIVDHPQIFPAGRFSKRYFLRSTLLGRCLLIISPFITSWHFISHSCNFPFPLADFFPQWLRRWIDCVWIVFKDGENFQGALCPLVLLLWRGPREAWRRCQKKGGLWRPLLAETTNESVSSDMEEHPLVTWTKPDTRLDFPFVTQFLAIFPPQPKGSNVKPRMREGNVSLYLQRLQWGNNYSYIQILNNHLRLPHGDK